MWPEHYDASAEKYNGSGSNNADHSEEKNSHLAGSERGTVEVERDGVVTVAGVLDPVEAELVAHVRDAVGLRVRPARLNQGPVTRLSLFRPEESDL